MLLFKKPWNQTIVVKFNRLPPDMAMHIPYVYVPIKDVDLWDKIGGRLKLEAQTQ